MRGRGSILTQHLLDTFSSWLGASEPERDQGEILVSLEERIGVFGRGLAERVLRIEGG